MCGKLTLSRRILTDRDIQTDRTRVEAPTRVLREGTGAPVWADRSKIQNIRLTIYPKELPGPPTPSGPAQPSGCEYRGGDETKEGGTLIPRGARDTASFLVGSALSHRQRASGVFGRAPLGATKSYSGRGRRMRAPPLRPSVELPMGPRHAAVGGGNACEHPGLQWSTLWGHEKLYTG
eukprot:3914233-Pyramimonas_sp.AAC.1